MAGQRRRTRRWARYRERVHLKHGGQLLPRCGGWPDHLEGVRVVERVEQGVTCEYCLDAHEHEVAGR